jgi:hypothetical protein
MLQEVSGLCVGSGGSVSGLTKPTGGLLTRFLPVCSYRSIGLFFGFPFSAYFPRLRAIWFTP